MCLHSRLLFLHGLFRPGLRGNMLDRGAALGRVLVCAMVFAA